MKKIVLLGDSIRMGYDSFVQEKLAGRAEVFFAEDNGRFVQYTLRTLSDWAAKNQWPSDIDVVHWNNGLWDCLHLNAAGSSCADGEAAGESIKPANTDPQYTYEKDPLTPPDFYRYFLVRTYRRIRLLFPQAAVVFATTTPVIEEQSSWAYRSNAEIEQYNTIARETLLPLGVKINELGEFAKLNCHNYHRDWVHYNDEGCSLLADEIIKYLEANALI
jgi:hypothetical protein